MAPSAQFVYEIGMWHGFKTSALTFTFDDNYRFQVTLATPVLNAHNYKATYFLVTNRIGKGWAPGWDTVNMLASQGHEIASHSKNHPDFVLLSQNSQWADSMSHEFKDSRDTINARVPSQKCETFAWPGGAVNESAINVSKNYYMACRGSSNLYNCQDPDNFYNIYSKHIYHDTPLETVNAFLDTALSLRGWLVERWHGFRNMHDTNGYEPVPIGEFRDHIDYVAGMEDKLWITTMDSVVKYIRERDASCLYFIDSTRYQVVIYLSNYLADTPYIYKVPLSLRVMIHPNMTNVYMITQGGNILPFKIIADTYGNQYLDFDALPNNGLITMHMAPVGMQESVVLNNGAENFPNPFTSSTTILFDIPNTGYVSILIRDALGHQLRDLSSVCFAGINQVEFRSAGLNPGIYFCNITTREKSWQVRMVKVQ